MATSAVHQEPAWLQNDVWLADEEPEGVADRRPDHQADKRDSYQRVTEQRAITRGVLLMLWLVVPQLAWIGLLGYLGLRFLP